MRVLAGLLCNYYRAVGEFRSVADFQDCVSVPNDRSIRKVSQCYVLQSYVLQSYPARRLVDFSMHRNANFARAAFRAWLKSNS